MTAQRPHSVSITNPPLSIIDGPSNAPTPLSQVNICCPPTLPAPVSAYPNTGLHFGGTMAPVPQMTSGAPPVLTVRYAARGARSGPRTAYRECDCRGYPLPAV
jgi:hypothetical protein